MEERRARMGLSPTVTQASSAQASSPAIAPAPKGILDPATGRPAGAVQGLRPDAGAALRDLDGVVRQWRRLLSLFLLGRARLRPYRADRHLRARLSADGGSAAVRRAAAAEEDPAHRDHRTLRF